MRFRLFPVLFTLLGLTPYCHAAEPTDNPVATYYDGPEGYPAWTDDINWGRVVNMKTYNKGKTDYEKFESARDGLAETGGVLYYPAGTYDFTTIPPGRGLMLRKGIVIRGEAPAAKQSAVSGKLDLPTKFLFPFRERGGGKVPVDWNFIGLMTDKAKGLKTINKVGIAWVHLNGATICFGPQMDWGKTWTTSGSPFSDHVKLGWGGRTADGTHPFDPLVGGGKKYQGVGSGRLVFGCVLEDAAVLDDFTEYGVGPDEFHTQRYCARVIAYGSRVLVANNLLPKSKKNFRYKQKVMTKPTDKVGTPSMIQFDYGKTPGIDINNMLLANARDDGRCIGYIEEGIVVRDNFVFNHGNTGYSIGGSWVTVSGNVNDRAFLANNDNVYGIGPAGVLTTDGWEAASPTTDNLSRAFVLAGKDIWVDHNKFSNTGSNPGTDGEGIVGRTTATPVYSWAITHNVHTKGVGMAGGMGGQEVECHGLLVGWNQTPGWVGAVVKKKDTPLNDVAIVGNRADRVSPDAKTVAALSLTPPLVTTPAGPAPKPTKVAAVMYSEDAVQIVWEAMPQGVVGYRVERKWGSGKWQPIAYRPPQVQMDPENPMSWIDFTAPRGQALTYRIVGVAADDSEASASIPCEPIRISPK